MCICTPDCASLCDCIATRHPRGLTVQLGRGSAEAQLDLVYPRVKVIIICVEVFEYHDLTVIWCGDWASG